MYCAVQMNKQASKHFEIDIFGTLLSFIVSTIFLSLLVGKEVYDSRKAGIDMPILRWSKTPEWYNWLHFPINMYYTFAPPLHPLIHSFT